MSRAPSWVSGLTSTIQSGRGVLPSRAGMPRPPFKEDGAPSFRTIEEKSTEPRIKWSPSWLAEQVQLVSSPLAVLLKDLCLWGAEAPRVGGL